MKSVILAVFIVFSFSVAYGGNCGSNCQVAKAAWQKAQQSANRARVEYYKKCPPKIKAKRLKKWVAAKKVMNKTYNTYKSYVNSQSQRQYQGQRQSVNFKPVVRVKVDNSRHVPARDPLAPEPIGDRGYQGMDIATQSNHMNADRKERAFGNVVKAGGYVVGTKVYHNLNPKKCGSKCKGNPDGDDQHDPADDDDGWGDNQYQNQNGSVFGVDDRAPW